MSLERQNWYVDFLINLKVDRSVNRHFIWLFENKDDRKAHMGYFFPKLKIKDYNVIINGKKNLDQPTENDLQNMITFKKLQLVKEMITPLIV